MKQSLPFLAGITARVAARRNPLVLPLDALLSAQIDYESRRVDLNGRKSSLALSDYFRELFIIARALWRSGGKRSAWNMIAGPFYREAGGLTAAERLQLGLELSQMMLDDNAPDRAASVLQQLLKDVQQDSISAEVKAQFWKLRVRCFNAVCAYTQALDAIQEALAVQNGEQHRMRLLAERAEILLLQGEDDPELNRGDDL